MNWLLARLVDDQIPLLLKPKPSYALRHNSVHMHAVPDWRLVCVNDHHEAQLVAECVSAYQAWGEDVDLPLVMLIQKGTLVLSQESLKVFHQR
jgi:hypothetical protein